MWWKGDITYNKRFDGSIPAYTKNRLVFWYDDKGLLLGEDVIGWNSLFKKEKKKEKKKKVGNSILVYQRYNVLICISSSKRFDFEDSPNPHNIGMDNN